MAAEQLLQAGHSADLYDAMPSVGRKFLLAGIGGLNITHSEDFAQFCARYAEREPELTPMLRAFGAEQVREWCTGLGVDTFIGTSGRVFPTEMKAAPLLRHWLTRLRKAGLRIHTRYRWLGWDETGALRFASPEGEISVSPAATVLALGGGSWKKLGSDGSWVSLLAAQGISIAPLRPANCGFLCLWSEHLRTTQAGSPLKPVSLSFTDLDGQTETRQGELILTAHGVEGSLIYAFSARLRDTLAARGTATFHLDLCPQLAHQQLSSQLQRRPARKSLGSFLKSSLKLDAAKTALLFEVLDKQQFQDNAAIAQTLKALPVTITATTPMDEAISTAGGVPFAELDQKLMLKALPGVFCAGEMLDWEAPTGGYLLTACMASGRWAGLGVREYLATL